MCGSSDADNWQLLYAVSLLSDQFCPPLRPVLDKPLRFCVVDVFKAVGAGVAVSGMIHTGSVQAGDRVTVVPAGEVATVKGLCYLNPLTPTVAIWLQL